MLETIEWTPAGVVMIDQTRLPLHEEFVTCRTYEDVAAAIRNMVIRGAPAIGVAAAMGVALVFSALYRVPGFQLGRASDLAFGFFCGFGLTHYYLDSRIWRVRSDPALRQALQLT